MCNLVAMVKMQNKSSCHNYMTFSHQSVFNNPPFPVLNQEGASCILAWQINSTHLDAITLSHCAQLVCKDKLGEAAERGSYLSVSLLRPCFDVVFWSKPTVHVCVEVSLHVIAFVLFPGGLLTFSRCRNAHSFLWVSQAREKVRVDVGLCLCVSLTPHCHDLGDKKVFLFVSSPY